MRHVKSIIVVVAAFCAACTSAPVSDNVNSFIDEGVKPFNDRILRAEDVNEDWVRDPRSIVETLFPSVDLTTQYDVTDSSENAVTIVFTREGFEDDSMEGEKRIIEFAQSNGTWRIERIRLGFKCKSGRGRQYYTGEFCR